jgi:hypothetical protein
MRRLTLKEVDEHHGGILPPDAVFRPDADEEPAAGVVGRPDNPAPQKRGDRQPGRAVRFALLNAFTDFALAGLTGAEVKVWLILFRDTKAATGIAQTGQADIGRRAGLSRRGVQVALDGLTAKGLVRVVRRGRLSVGPSAYRVQPTGAA